MKTRFQILTWAFAATCVLLCASGCGGGASGIMTPSAPIEARVTTDKTTYRLGEPVPTTVTFRNVSSTDQTLTSSEANFFYVSVTPEGQEQKVADVFQGGSGQLVTTIVLQPGETKVISYSWNQIGSFNGNVGQVPPGRYVLRSYLQGNPPDKLQNFPVTITLTN